jgi:hypothetical protein
MSGFGSSHYVHLVLIRFAMFVVCRRSDDCRSALLPRPRQPWLRVVAAVAFASVVCASGSTGQETCSSQPSSGFEADPALQEMTYIEEGTKNVRKIQVYVQPHVSTFYRDASDPQQQPQDKMKKLVTPKHNGLLGKFINMSNKQLTLYW